MGGKQLGLVILVIVVVVAVVLLLKGYFGGSTPPDPALDKMVKKVDEKTGAVIEKSVRDWNALGKSEEGKYKNPETKEYTMVTPHTCASCGALIPPIPETDLPARPEYPTKTGPDDNRWMKIRRDYETECEEIRLKYICPECGKPAYTTGLGARRRR